MTENNRVILGFLVVLVGLGATLYVMHTALTKFDKVPDVTALISAVGAVIGPIVGAFFGVQVGAAGKAKAENDRDKAVQARDTAEKARDTANKKVELLSGAMEKQEFQNFLRQNADLFAKS
jgi:hypothetical protein